MRRFSKSLAAGLAFPAIALTGCYVVPIVDPQGNVQYHHYPLPPHLPPGTVPPPGYASGRGLSSINASRSSGLVTARIVVLATRV